MSHLIKKSLLMLALVATFAVAQASTAVGQQVFDVQAIVDIGTGEIILELGGGGTQVISIHVGEGSTFVNVFDITAFDATTGLGPNFGISGIGVLSQTPFPAGTFNFGAILDESFRSQEGAESLEIQFGQTILASETITVANGGITVINSAIPEPGSLSLFALASLGVVARRRR